MDLAINVLIQQNKNTTEQCPILLINLFQENRIPHVCIIETIIKQWDWMEHVIKMNILKIKLEEEKKNGKKLFNTTL